MNTRSGGAKGPGCFGFVLAIAVCAIAFVILSARGVLPFQLSFELPAPLQEILGVEKPAPEAPSESEVMGEAAYELTGIQVSDYYVYNQLNEDDQQKYRAMLEAFQTREKREYPSADADDMGHIRDCIMADHPEFFDMISVHSETTTTVGLFSRDETTMIEGVYEHDVETTETMRLELDEAAWACLAAMPQGLDDYGKAKYLYDYVVETVTYDWDAAWSLSDGSEQHLGQTAYDALVNKRAVCGGYARAFQYLAQKLGLPCEYVTGASHGGSHAWNVVKLDGEYYHVDATWGDPQFEGEGGESFEGVDASYDYLCIPTEDVLINHTIDDRVPVPPCESRADNYYVRENAYLSTANVGQVGVLLQDALARGAASVQVRCANRDAYDQLLFDLFSAQMIYAFLPSSSCHYVLNEGFCSIKILL